MDTKLNHSLPLARPVADAVDEPRRVTIRLPAGFEPTPPLLVAAAAVLVHRYTGEPDVLVGRRAPGVAGTVALTVTGEVTVEELLAAVAAATPLPAGADTPPAVVVSDGAPARTPIAPLTLVLGDDSSLELLTSTAEFDADAAAQYARHLERAIEAVAEPSAAASADRRAEPRGPGLPFTVGDLPLLTDEETHRALVEWNRTEAPVPAPYIHELVAGHASTTPDAVAVATPTDRVTYRELDDRANQLAHRLSTMGIGRDDMVGVCFPRGADSLIAQLACFKVAAAAILLDPDFPVARTRFMIEDASAAAVLTLAAHADALAGSCPVLALDTSGYRDEPTTPVNEPLDTDDLIHIGYTSGSTGAPKAVLARFGAARNLIHAMRELCGMTADSQGTWLAAPGYGMVQVECFPVLAAGATVNIPETSVVASPERLHEWFLRQRITTTLLMKPMAERLWALDWPADTALRDIRVCGERIQSWPPAGLPFRLINLYGSSEATTVASCDITDLGARLGPAGRATMVPPIGRPICNVKTFVLDERHRPVPPGVVGELCITGDSLSAGYLNRPELTAQKWIPNPIDPERDPILYRTGDLARYWADGSIEIVGRRDNQIKVRGNTVHLGEIEIVLAAQPGVRQVAVLAHEDGHGDAQLTAYIEPASGRAPVVRDIRRTLRKRLPAFMVPSAYVVGGLPLNTNGKIDRSALPEPPRSRPDVDSAYQAPRTDRESSLHELWTAALEIDGIGVFDNFFDLGGDSLRAARVTRQICDRYGVDIEVGDLFEEPTIATMATLVAA